MKKDNSGALFKNDRKTPESNQPDYRGDVTVAGQTYRLSAWIKEGRNGKFMSLALTPEQTATETAAPAPVERKVFEVGLADEVPF